MRQGANSAVRFGSYSTLKRLVQDYQGSTTPNLSAASTFGVGGCAGVITVCEAPDELTRSVFQF